jgi:hypothetical protein
MATLEELAVMELEIGQEYAVEGNFCRHCESTDLVLHVRLMAVPGALAGMQSKTSALKVYVLGCHGCGRESTS